MTLSAQDVRRVAARPKEVALGVLAQYSVMPLLALAITVLLRLPPDVAVGVILLGTCPGGTASNVVTYLARGDLALSVAMTSASTLLAPLLTPFLTLWLAGRLVPVSASALFESIVKIVLVPVIAGLLVNRFASKTVERLTPALPLVSVSAIVAIVAFVLGANLERIQSIALTAFIAVLLHNTLGLLAGYGLGSMLGADEAKRRALSIEIGMQNSGLAVSLASLHFTAAAAVPGALFSVWHNLSGPMLASYWSRRPTQRQRELGN